MLFFKSKTFLIIAGVIVAAIIYFFAKGKNIKDIGQPGFGRPYTGDFTKLTSYTAKAKKALEAGYYVPVTADTYGADVARILDWMWEITNGNGENSWGRKYLGDMVALAEHAAWQASGRKK
jgi:hypothetical protein